MTAPHPPRRILLIRPSALGDVCRTVPVLASLRRAFAQAEIDWLVQDTFAPAISEHPALTRSIAFPRRAFSRWGDPAVTFRIARFLRSLARNHYDLVLDCQGLARSGIFAAATCAPRRVGQRDVPELAWLGLNEHLHGIAHLHTVDRMLAIASAAGAPPVADMRLYSAESDRRHVIATLDLTPGSYVLLAPTSRWPGKLWPDDRFAAVVTALLSDARTSIDRVVLVGSASERSQCPRLLDLAARDVRIIDLLGKTTVGQLLALVQDARLVIGSDSAALHMAVGFDRPMIGLFGPTRIERVGPYRRDHDVLQHVSPTDRLDHKNEAAGRALMARITTEQVLERAARLLSLAAAPRPATVVTSSPARAPTS